MPVALQRPDRNVMKERGRYVVMRSFGSSADEGELCSLEGKAKVFIRTHGKQQVIDVDAQTAAEETRYLAGSIRYVIMNGQHLILDRIYDGIGFGALKEDLLRDLVVSRVYCPRSKLATVDFLRRYKCTEVDINAVNRQMDEAFRQRVQSISAKHTRQLLGGQIGIVFYDVTMPYFETAGESD